VESIDFDFLLEGGVGGEPPPRDPRTVRSIEDASRDAEIRLSRRQRGSECGFAPSADGDLGMTDDEVLALDESDLECLWPAWGERRAAQLGRGVPPGVTVVPQHLPRSASSAAGRPLSYK
jgi:hypothetical protein